MSSLSVRNAAACCKCQEVRRDRPAIFICKKGHNVCEVCKPMAKKCPVNKCSYNKTPLRNEALERLVKENVEFECKYKENGCGIRLVLAQLSQHESGCECRPVACTNQGCAQTMPCKMLIKHLYEECPKRLVPCPELGCNAKVADDGLKGHRASCNFRMVFCPETGCGKMVAANALHGHQSGCGFRTVPCPETGCRVEVVLNALQKHRGTCDFRMVSCNKCSTFMIAHVLPNHMKTDCSSRLVPCPYPWCGGGPTTYKSVQSHLKTHGSNVRWITQNPVSVTLGSGFSASWMDEKHPLVAFHVMGKLFLMHVYYSVGLIHVWVSADGNSSNKRCTIVLEGNGNKIAVSSDVFRLDQPRSDVMNDRNCIQLSSRGLEPFMETANDGTTKVKFTLETFEDGSSSSV